MEFKFADRMDNFQEGIFTTLANIKKKRINENKPVFDLSVGTPDFVPEKHIMDALVKAAQVPDNYKYAINDTDELIEAVKIWYKRRYRVDLESDQIMSLYGSQEGLSRIALTICNPGDTVLVPNPGYPVFAMGPMLNDAHIEYYELREDNNYVIDFKSIPEELAKKAKAIVVSYPANPICRVAPVSMYKELIEWAKKYNVIVLHDNAYSELVYDGKEGISFLSVDGAMDVGIEFNSLSKTYNLTGARISFAIGNSQIISQFKKLRSQIDYGIFLPIQKAAVAALLGPQTSVERNKQEYEDRRNALADGLASIGWKGVMSEGTMFAWAPLPDGYTDSQEFVLELINKAGVVCVPGSAFGSLGEGHVRFALVYPVEKMKLIVQAIKESGIIKK
ncbi:MAG: aminotransferase class I/II-fold pyridoxal phosphate-dependent enzyme [Clostridia bacterium]|jgi:LL-diaminopimelate aminotransferase|nr:aminotransferase class I/II-fold pyridoxal phosphate-dependent enzyme [Clostridia bacterium]